MPNKLFSLIIIALVMSVVVVSYANASINPISEETCSAVNPCSGDGLECYVFPTLGARCAESNPCSYYNCFPSEECRVLETYPAQVTCPPKVSPSDEGMNDTVSYDSVTGAVTFTKAPEPSKDMPVSLQSTGENQGIMQVGVGGIKVKYSGSLEIQQDKLVMEINGVKGSINVLPETAVGVSETPNLELVQGITLKEESGTPVYEIKGRKRVKFMFIIPVLMKVETKVDAETGVVEGVKKPWWAFLASE